MGVRCCSTAEEVITIIDSFRDPNVTCCWDFGHAAVAFRENMLEELKKVGNRLSSTHVHDNNMRADLHSTLLKMLIMKLLFSSLMNSTQAQELHMPTVQTVFSGLANTTRTVKIT